MPLCNILGGNKCRILLEGELSANEILANFDLKAFLTLGLP
jgi:hypothetical protein